MVYGYHRTSTREQHLDRGIAEITKYCEEHNMKLEKVKEFLFSLLITLGLPYMLLVLAYVLG